MTPDQTSPANGAGAFRASACLGFLGVALGAFGAHWLKDYLAAHGVAAIWEKAVLYHLVHTGVMLMVAGRPPYAVAAWRLLATGVFCFSGSLYAYALTGMHWLVFVTPLGGLALLAGWLCLAMGTNQITASGTNTKSP